MKRAKKNKRLLNGPSAAKNRREVLNLDDNTDEEADIFITQTTPPPKKEEEQTAPIAIAQPATRAHHGRPERRTTV